MSKKIIISTYILAVLSYFGVIFSIALSNKLTVSSIFLLILSTIFYMLTDNWKQKYPINEYQFFFDKRTFELLIEALFLILIILLYFIAKPNIFFLIIFGLFSLIKMVKILKNQEVA